MSDGPGGFGGTEGEEHGGPATGVVAYTERALVGCHDARRAKAVTCVEPEGPDHFGSGSSKGSWPDGRFEPEAPKIIPHAVAG
jgi:hypothetical protein